MMIGTQVEQYRIEAKVGEGGMGSVYRALDVNLDRVVALKFLNQGLEEHGDLSQRFRTEARAQATLNHQNIATLYAFLVWQNKAVMVMEYIEGESLQQMVARRGPIPAGVAVPLFKQALEGIAVAHRRGIIHRDLKPANLMLNTQGVVKVMDFGIAKVQGNAGLTRTNTMMGTAWYMAPEQIMGRPVDARTDVYSMGVTLYELLAGTVPFQADSEYEIQTAHVQRVPERPTIHYPHIPEALVDAVMRALEKEPARRFASADEFLAALPDVPLNQPTPAQMVPASVPILSAQASIPPPGATALQTIPPTPSHGKVRRWLAPAAFALATAVVLSFAGWYLSQRRAADVTLSTQATPRLQQTNTNESTDGPAGDSAPALDPAPAKKTPAAPAKAHPAPIGSEPVAPKISPTAHDFSGQWTGTYVDSVTHEVTQVAVTMNQPTAETIGGTLRFTTATAATGSCLLNSSKYDKESKLLTLILAKCEGATRPAFLNVPTQFANVDPSTEVLAHGHTLYLHNNIAVTMRRQ